MMNFPVHYRLFSAYKELDFSADSALAIACCTEARES